MPSGGHGVAGEPQQVGVSGGRFLEPIGIGQSKGAEPGPAFWAESGIGEPPRGGEVLHFTHVPTIRRLQDRDPRVTRGEGTQLRVSSSQQSLRWGGSSLEPPTAGSDPVGPPSPAVIE